MIGDKVDDIQDEVRLLTSVGGGGLIVTRTLRGWACERPGRLESRHAAGTCREVLAARGRCTHAELREATGLDQRALWQAVVKLRGRNLVTKVEVFEAEP